MQNPTLLLVACLLLGSLSVRAETFQVPAGHDFSDGLPSQDQASLAPDQEVGEPPSTLAGERIRGGFEPRLDHVAGAYGLKPGLESLLLALAWYRHAARPWRNPGVSDSLGSWMATGNPRRARSLARLRETAHRSPRTPLARRLGSWIPYVAAEAVSPEPAPAENLAAELMATWISPERGARLLVLIPPEASTNPERLVSGLAFEGRIEAGSSDPLRAIWVLAPELSAEPLVFTRTPGEASFTRRHGTKSEAGWGIALDPREAHLLDRGVAAAGEALPPTLGSKADPSVRFRKDKLDPSHPYLSLQLADTYRRGIAQGVVAKQGSLQLAKGVSRGRYVTPALKQPTRFHYAMTGTRTKTPPGGKVQFFLRGMNSKGRSVSKWTQVSKETEVFFRIAATFLQILVLLERGTNGMSPKVQGLTLTPFGNPNQPLSKTPGQSPSWLPFSNPQTSSGTPGGTPAGTSAGPSPSGSVPSAQAGIIPRQAWGAVNVQAGGSHQPSSITIHHSEYPIDSWKGERAVQEIQRLHREDRGWGDIGYHFLVGHDGRIFEGRPWQRVGAHSPPNSGRIGICLLGSFQSKDQLAPAQYQGLIQAIRWVIQNTSVPAQAKISGHRDQRSTDCPGDRVYTHIQSGKLAQDVAASR